MNLEAIEQALSESARARLQEVRIYEQIDSTNAECLRRLRLGDTRDCLLIAEEQQAGRGRRGRSWISPRGQGIYMSLLRGFSPDTGQLHGLSLVAAISVRAALVKLGAEGLQLKWPNDIYHNGCKLGGILLELYNGEQHNFVVFGIGINLELAEKTVATIPQAVTDLAGIIGDLPARPLMVATLVDTLMTNIDLFERHGFSYFRKDWNAADCFIGREVELVDGNRSMRGRAAGVDAQGSLLLDTAQGSQRFLSGEITPSLRSYETDKVS